MPQHTNTNQTDGHMSPKVWYQAASASPDFVHDAALTDNIVKYIMERR